MHQLIQYFFFVQTVLGTVLPSLQPKQSQGQSFKVPRVRNAQTKLSGPAELRKAFHKHGWQFPFDLSRLAEEDNVKIEVVHQPPPFPKPSSSPSYPSNGSGSGKVAAEPEKDDSAYVSAVTIGGQPLVLDFDTGSSDFWVFSTLLPPDMSKGHHLYNPSKSSTFTKDKGAKWVIQYGDGTGAVGIAGYDRVNVGSVTVLNQTIELATMLSQTFVEDKQNDGIAGLGFMSGNKVQPHKAIPFFEKMKPQLAQRLFSVNLNEQGTGYYEFGNVDSSAYTGSLTRIPVNPAQGYWQLNSPAYAINGRKSFNFDASPAIADTGTSLLLLDQPVVQKYWSHVPSASYSDVVGGYIFPCSQASKLPDFAVSMGSSDFLVNISSQYINYGPIRVGSPKCFGAIQGNNGYPLQILGDPLFRSAFVVFEDCRGVGGTDEFLGLQVGEKA